MKKQDLKVKLPTLQELFQAGAHFGHTKQRLHPKAKKFVFGVQKGVAVIDLSKSLIYIKQALEYIQSEVRAGRNFLVIGTKKQFSDLVKQFAEHLKFPYVNYKWLGGTLTNFETIKQTIQRLEKMEAFHKSEEYQHLPKSEQRLRDKELARLRRDFNGLRQLERLPDNLFVIDAWEERTAVAEARKLGIPIVAITDTNWNPDELDYIIPLNDDVAPAVKLALGLVEEALDSIEATSPVKAAPVKPSKQTNKSKQTKKAN